MNSKPIPKGSTNRTKVPKWVLSIPKGSHGSGDLQKRLWRVVSDFVRIRDWTKYGSCVATGTRIEHWKDGDAGHFVPYSKCNGLFKFNPMNIHLQSKSSNGWGGFDQGAKYAATLTQRYGPSAVELIETENRVTPLKFTTAEILDMMGDYLNLMGHFGEQPAYYQRARELRDKEL
jgi:hypothetical protein